MNINRTKEQQPKSDLEDLLLAFRRRLVEAFKKEGMKNDLTFSQVEIMRFIGEYGAVTMNMIAKHLKIAPPSVTSLISEMNKKGLVERRDSKGDRRQVVIAFTPKAKKIFKKISKHKQTILHSMLEKLSVEDRKSLERIISILIKE